MKVATAPDFETLRQELAADIALAEAEAERLDDRLGALALDVRMGIASEATLDRARAEHAAAERRVLELHAANDAVDEREHAAAEVAEAHQRVATEKELAEVSKRRGSLALRASGLLAELGPIVSEVCNLEGREILLSRKLGGDRSPRASRALATIAVHQLAGLPGMPYVRADAAEAARASLED